MWRKLEKVTHLSGVLLKANELPCWSMPGQHSPHFFSLHLPCSAAGSWGVVGWTYGACHGPLPFEHAAPALKHALHHLGFFPPATHPPRSRA